MSLEVFHLREVWREVGRVYDEAMERTQKFGNGKLDENLSEMSGA